MTIDEYINAELLAGRTANYSIIARDVPCDPSYISMIAKGKKQPSYGMARRIEMVTNGKVERSNWYPNDR